MPTRNKIPSPQRFKLPDECLIKFDNIDAEHSTLIDILNGCLSGFGQNKKIALPDFDKCFRRLWQEMSTHFQHEEAEMKQVQYPELLGHKHHHAEVISRLASIRDNTASCGYVDRSFIEEIFDTIVDDMLRADLSFKNFLQQKGIL